MRCSFLLAFLIFFPSFLFAGWLPSKKKFLPFKADTTYPSYAVKLTSIVKENTRAEINIGDEFGIYLKNFNNSMLQFGIMGGVAARFDISKITNDFEVADFSLVFPVDYLVNSWGFRAAYWHTSSHLGDDYIKSSLISLPNISKVVTDDIRFYASYLGIKKLRLYGGFFYSFNAIPSASKKYGLHTGAEVLFAKTDKGNFFTAFDLRALQKHKWQPSFSARTGYKILGEGQSVSIFGEFFCGRSAYLQLSETKETKWAFGFSFEM